MPVYRYTLSTRVHSKCLYIASCACVESNQKNTRPLEIVDCRRRACSLPTEVGPRGLRRVKIIHLQCFRAYESPGALHYPSRRTCARCDRGVYPQEFRLSTRPPPLTMNTAAGTLFHFGAKWITHNYGDGVNNYWKSISPLPHAQHFHVIISFGPSEIRCRITVRIYRILRIQSNPLYWDTSVACYFVPIKRLSQ